MISFDLDMTLLDHRTDQITPSALEAIEKLRPKHRIVLATGRDMDNYYSTSYRDIVRPDAIVHMNGTKITVGDKLLFEHIFDPELLRRVLSFCDEKGFGIGMTVGMKITISIRRSLRLMISASGEAAGGSSRIRGRCSRCRSGHWRLSAAVNR